MSGRFISLEGGEGVGKSTQARRLAEALIQRGVDVVLTREPGGSPGAEAVRALLLEGEGERWTPTTEALLFAAARADHVARTIRPALARGATVICDRFIDSSRAYQGAAGVDDAAIMALHAIGSGGLLPDRTLLLSLPPGEAAARAMARDGGNADRIGGRDAAYHAKVATLLASFARAERRRFRFVDAAGAEDVVTRRLLVAALDGTAG
ncbi:dTMP kinase [Sphingomonas flavalba]|uniref:dTMP kinase n=1 Tax=Sphingomonas flavalba TaxID=2559804 RepID=UPI0039DF3DDF